MPRAASMARAASPPLSMNGGGGGPGLASPMMGAPGQVRGGGYHTVYHVGYDGGVGVVLCDRFEVWSDKEQRCAARFFFCRRMQQVSRLKGFDRREQVVCMIRHIYIGNECCFCSWLINKPWFLPGSGG